ncbi:MAG TPA: hypothetical protein VFW33_18760, partial [Gemmataceae bacterium]|nr:hypothetical protein [Gemmataceae bacterium]
MCRVLPPLVVVLLAASPAPAALEISKVEACYGRLGPVRKSLDIYAYDEIGFRFTVTGARSDDEGRADVEVAYTVLDDRGKEVTSKRVASLKGPLTFGTDSFPGYVSLWLTEPPGEYTLKVTVKDNVAAAETGFERKLHLKETEFAIVSPQFFHDATHAVAAPAGGVVGQQLHFRLLVIGFDRSAGKLDEELVVRVFDKDKKELTPKPLRMTAEKTDEKVVKELPAIDFSGWVMLTKAGEFTLRITVTDINTKKTATWEAPL